MTSATRYDTVHGDANDLTARLRPAEIHIQKMVSQAAGPFEVPADTSREPSMREALMTGLLVIYPALATVAAIVAGLFLAGFNGT